MSAIEHDEYIIIIAILFLCFDLTFLRDKKCIEMLFYNPRPNLHKSSRAGTARKNWKRKREWNVTIIIIILLFTGVEKLTENVEQR